jgi:hypothetical protein
MSTKKIVLAVAAVVFVLGLLAALFVGGIAAFAIYTVGNSEATARAQAFLRGSEKLKTDIGEVRDFGSIVTGNVSFQNNNGEATLHLKVIGERKTVNASVDLVYTNGRAWRVNGASYVNTMGQVIDLLDPYDSKVSTPVLIA